jgi:putative flavoprotein involved in K+ transport
MTYDYIVVGAGQAGLSMAYHLKQAGYNFLVIDGDNEIGGSWLRRWDSLTLFTPSQYNNLPGMDFPMAEGHYPDKNEVADYLKKYVKTFDLPIRFNCKADKMTRVNDTYHVDTPTGQLKATNVVVATGPFHTPFKPKFNSQLSDDIVQLHACEYKNPGQLQDGETLVVGAGDSGVQILSEISNTDRKVYFSGNCSSAMLPQEFLGKTLWWWLGKLGILSASKHSWLGKQLSTRMQPVIGTNLKQILAKDNVAPVGRSLDGNGHTIDFEKGQIDTIKNIVWATGFRPDFSWINNVTLDEKGYPENQRGIGKQEGLYFIGLPWMHTRGSATLGGVQNDAKFLMEHFLTVDDERTDMDVEMEAALAS